MTTITNSRIKAFSRKPWPRPGIRVCVNRPRVLSVLVSSGERNAGRRHVRESKMRQLGELEAVIMDRLWEWGRPALVREVLDDLRKDRPLAYTTVMTVMENLHRKGWLRRDRDGRAWRYEPAGSRSGYSSTPFWHTSERTWPVTTTGCWPLRKSDARYCPSFR